MKYLVFVLMLAVLLVPMSSRSQDVRRRPIKASVVAPPALVQQKVATVADGSAGVTATFDTPLTAGNSVIACISALTADFNDAPTLEGSGGEFLTVAETVTVVGVTTYIYYLHNITGGEIDLFFTTVDAVRASVNVSEWSGLSNAVPEDTSTSSSAGSATLAVVPATLDPTSGNNLVIGIGGYANAVSAYSSGPTNSFTRLTTTGGASVFQEAAYLIRAGDHSAVTSNVTLGSSLAWASCAVAFGAP